MTMLLMLATLAWAGPTAPAVTTLAPQQEAATTNAPAGRPVFGLGTGLAVGLALDLADGDVATAPPALLPLELRFFVGRRRLRSIDVTWDWPQSIWAAAEGAHPPVTFSVMGHIRRPTSQGWHVAIAPGFRFTTVSRSTAVDEDGFAQLALRTRLGADIPMRDRPFEWGLYVVPELGIEALPSEYEPYGALFFAVSVEATVSWTFRGKRE